MDSSNISNSSKENSPSGLDDNSKFSKKNSHKKLNKRIIRGSQSQVSAVTETLQ